MSALRTIPDDFDADLVSQIDARLAGIVGEHGVRIPWAIESGSRAWGFASPDSDYDCRFFFVRPRASYLSLWPVRDVIETPLEGLLDVNGWDVAKAVRLAVAGNATVGEWLRSPWVYAGEAGFRDELLTLVDAVTDRSRLRRHYLHVGRDQWSAADSGDGSVRLKKVFYAIRPAITLHWLDAYAGVPPMSLGELLAEVDLPEDVLAELSLLREQKARSRELGTAALPPAIAAWVEDTLSRVDDELVEPGPDVRARAQGGFEEILDRWAPHRG